MSALKRVVNLLWYRTPKDHKLANALVDEFSELETENKRLKALTTSAAGLIKNITDDELWEHAQIWLNEYGKDNNE